MKTLKKFLSVLLVMLAVVTVCSVTVIPVNASSEDDIPNYLTFQAEMYSSEEFGF